MQAYGLDIVGDGFFTMKHQVKNIRKEICELYDGYDSFGMYRLVYDEIERLSKHYLDNFFAFNRDTPQKRLERMECELIDAFWTRYEFGLLG